MARAAAESRGFAVTRLLTHWPEIVGEAVARIAGPVAHPEAGLTRRADSTLTEQLSARFAERIRQLGVQRVLWGADGAAGGTAPAAADLIMFSDNIVTIPD